MVEEETKEKSLRGDPMPSGESEERSRTHVTSKILIFPCFVCFSVTALLILATALFFQMQLIALERELAALKAKPSDPAVEEEKARSLRKRSSLEVDDGPPGARAVHLQGSLPFQHIHTQGKIGPWTSSSEETFFRLEDKNSEIRINERGIYFVYAQIYYLTSSPHNSFQILSHNGTEERRSHRVLATCSAQGRNSVGEVSCYTGFSRTFDADQRLYLNQIEQNRIIHFTNGCSYFGVVLLRGLTRNSDE